MDMHLLDEWTVLRLAAEVFKRRYIMTASPTGSVQGAKYDRDFKLIIVENQDTDIHFVMLYSCRLLYWPRLRRTSKTERKRFEDLHKLRSMPPSPRLASHLDVAIVPF